MLWMHSYSSDGDGGEVGEARMMSVIGAGEGAVGGSWESEGDEGATNSSAARSC